MYRSLVECFHTEPIATEMQDLSSLERVTDEMATDIARWHKNVNVYVSFYEKPLVGTPILLRSYVTMISAGRRNSKQRI